MIKLTPAQLQQLQPLFNQTNNLVFDLVKIVQDMQPNNPDIELLRRNVILYLPDNPGIIVVKITPLFLMYAKKIRDHDEQFFINESNYFKGDAADSIARNLISSIKPSFLAMNEGEKEYIWQIVNEILTNVAKYEYFARNGAFP